MSRFFFRDLTDSLGICLPIMLNNLIAKHGFPKAVQYSGYLLLGTLVLASLLMHPRFVPASLRSGPMKKPSPAELFKSKPYSLLVAGLFFVAWGLFFPIFVSRTRDIISPYGR